MMQHNYCHWQNCIIPYKTEYCQRFVIERTLTALFAVID